MTLYGKLTDIEMQLLLYLSHVVVKDLVQAKQNGRVYDGLIVPDELLDLLKRLKVETLNNPQYCENKVTNNIFPENTPANAGASVYSFQPSEYSKEEI
jgi:hypothetical protein